MTDQERIARLEHTVGTLISWLYPIPFSSDAAVKLLEMLEERSPSATE